MQDIYTRRNGFVSLYGVYNVADCSAMLAILRACNIECWATLEY